jgi:hypothetical protein
MDKEEALMEFNLDLASNGEISTALKMRLIHLSKRP